MKTKTLKTIKWLSVAILLLATVFILFDLVSLANKLWLASEGNRIVWMPDHKAWQVFILAGRVVTDILLYVFLFCFLVKTDKAMKSGVIFPKANISVIRWAALTTILSTFVQSNYQGVLEGDPVSVLESNTFIVPLFIFLFAGLYKMAYLSAKDSNLAI